MRKKLLTIALLAALATTQQARTQSRTTYSKMAPADQYLMADRTAEIALARTAAPDAIARDADVLVLGLHGFETAIKGRNGFVCIVGRSFTSAPDEDFWDPNVRVPMCANAPAARSYLLRLTRETGWILAGRTKVELAGAIASAVETKELPPMEPGAMCYMMSKEGFGGSAVPHWPSHLMFFYSDTDPAIWGANLSASPITAVADPMEHLTQFVITTQRWSDGTEALQATPHVHP
ncbi:hypothetical protein [Granulicella arctica]|uniref:hypothetical protein n=1 Tax=Granulicella arctica TaxID=940613 RepID=UPI0021E0996C|nr:hypothetical protein [Granulicella arctica]